MSYYRNMKFAIFLAALLTGTPFAQAVYTGTRDPHYCFDIEKIRPNLILSATSHLFGHIQDETTAPFKNSPVELRGYVSERNPTAETSRYEPTFLFGSFRDSKSIFGRVKEKVEPWPS